MRKFLLPLLVGFVLIDSLPALAQPVTGAAQVNGLADRRATPIAVTHAKLWITPDRMVEDGMVEWVRGRVTYAGPMRPLAADVQVFDAHGKTVYPAFVEMISDLGQPQSPPQPFSPGKQPQYQRDNAANRYWNEHIKPETRAASSYKYDDNAAGAMRKMGFAYTLTQQRDGIARGTAALVALAPERPNDFDPILKAEAAACYSFQRSRQTLQQYPGSLMGSIALLRQVFIDAKTPHPGNVSLDELSRTASLPQLFEAGQRLNILRADKLAREAGRSFIYRGQGDEYMRLDALKRTGAPLVVPVNLPKPYDVTDPLEAEQIDLADLMHGERAAYNLGMLQKAGIKVAVTMDQLKDKSDFWPNLRKSVKSGLSEAEALRALTQTPARLLKADADLGTLEPGHWASFVIADKSLFQFEGKIMETWVAGQRYAFTDALGPDLAGKYKLTIGGDSTYAMTVLPAGEAFLKGSAGRDTAKRKLTWVQQEGYVVFSGKFMPDTSGTMRLSGLLMPGRSLRGEATLPSGKLAAWSARRTGDAPNPADTAKFRPAVAAFGPLPYPFNAYGSPTLPASETILYKNATLWTNESGGKMEGADILISNGKIAAVGKGLAAPKDAKVQDMQGRHITPGIIDEHSHIAINGGVNECTHSVTAECRIGDVLNSEDPNIYRHLAAGVTAAQLLHGSCNTIGGQSALIKMRWGQEPEQLKIAGADGFIKCALGENVKQSNFGDPFTVRYPQTRMGVEQVFKDAFARATAYRDGRKAYAALPAAQKKTQAEPRRDLQLEALLEIQERHRFITCHSYVASEILMLMRVADSLGFRVNTFTHILEGYKVAREMAKHGAGGSTFADWWYYKAEVQDAIPYNAVLMHDVGVTVAINSDDAEMARRLNQEAAKTVRYGGMTEEEAMKTITLNPAKLLHLDSHMGSLKVGKDADIVIWDKHPFAAGAKPIRTYVDGMALFDIETDAATRTRIQSEKNRLIRLQADNKGPAAQPPAPGKPPRMYHCEDSDGRDESWGG